MMDVQLRGTGFDSRCLQRTRASGTHVGVTGTCPLWKAQKSAKPATPPLHASPEMSEHTAPRVSKRLLASGANKYSFTTILYCPALLMFVIPRQCTALTSHDIVPDLICPDLIAVNTATPCSRTLAP